MWAHVGSCGGISLKYGLLTKCEVKMAGYWPSSFICVFMDQDRVGSINSQKKNEANIQYGFQEIFLAGHGG